jgi:serine protease Do
MSFLKESPIVRYAYGVTGALLIGGTAFSLATGPVGADELCRSRRPAPAGGC